MGRINDARNNEKASIASARSALSEARGVVKSAEGAVDTEPKMRLVASQVKFEAQRATKSIDDALETKDSSDAMTRSAVLSNASFSISRFLRAMETAVVGAMDGIPHERVGVSTRRSIPTRGLSMMASSRPADRKYRNTQGVPLGTVASLIPARRTPEPMLR
jgi:hypothetical protein